MRAAAGMMVLMLAVAGCSTSGAESHSYRGPVTRVDDAVVCVGAPAANGQCFLQDAVTKTLELNDCVRVKYSSKSDESGPYVASSIKREPAESGNACAGE